jgi:non-ribosomal peptide synthetase component E (peptide arylation enzyme)
MKMGGSSIEITHWDTLPVILAKRAKATPDRIYVEEVDKLSFSFAAFNSLILEWAAAFQSLGVGSAWPVLVEGH